MIRFNGDFIHIVGDIVKISDNPGRVTIQASKDDCRRLREYVEPFYKGTDPKFRPGWLDGNKNTLTFTSRFPIPIKIEGYEIKGIGLLLDKYGILRDSRVVCTIHLKGTEDKMGCYLKGIEFVTVNSVNIEDFFKEDNA